VRVCLETVRVCCEYVRVGLETLKKAVRLHVFHLDTILTYIPTLVSFVYKMRRLGTRLLSACAVPLLKEICSKK